MITKEQAMALPIGTVLYHVKLKSWDGTTLRMLVRGKCQTWKRRISSSKWRLPCLHERGARKAVYIGPKDADEWCLYDPADVYAKAGIGPDAPWQIVYDRLLDAGHDKLAELYLADLEASALPS